MQQVSQVKRLGTVDATNWDIVITARRGWFDIDISGLWRYRDLALLLFKRDFISLYKQTVLGPLWYLIQPVLSTAAYVLIFNRIARIPTDDLPPVLFYMAGVVIWTFFSSCLSKTSDTFVSNSGIFSKVYFPRLIVPISVALSNLLAFAVQFALLLVCLGYFWMHGSLAMGGIGVFFVVPLLVYVAALGLGTGIIVSSFTTRYRDLAYVLGFATQLWMYSTPIVYPLSQIPENWRWLFLLNPMTAPVETFRATVLGSGSVSAELWLVNSTIAFGIVFVGLAVFSRAEKNSMDTV